MKKAQSAGSGTRNSRRLFALLGLFILGASAGDLPADPSEYPRESLRLADELAPLLAGALSSCDVDAAKSIYRRTNEFMYKQWQWDEHIERLKPYRVCYQMLSDIAATTKIVTDRNAALSRYRFVAGMFDANYAECLRFVEPTAPSSKSLKMVWPDRFGSEPEWRACFKSESEAAGNLGSVGYLH